MLEVNSMPKSTIRSTRKESTSSRKGELSARMENCWEPVGKFCRETEEVDHNGVDFAKMCSSDRAPRVPRYSP